MWKTPSHFLSKTITWFQTEYSAKQNKTKHKKVDFWNVARVRDAHVFLIHMCLTSLNEGKNERGCVKYLHTHTSTVTVVLIRPRFYSLHKIYSIFRSFRMNWNSKEHIHRSPPIYFICSTHTQHSAEMRCEIYCNSRPPLSLIQLCQQRDKYWQRQKGDILSSARCCGVDSKCLLIKAGCAWWMVEMLL